MKIIIYTSYPYCVSAFCIKNIKILPSLFDSQNIYLDNK